MFSRLSRLVVGVAPLALIGASVATGPAIASGPAQLVPMAIFATRDAHVTAGAACTSPAPESTFGPFHCYTPDQIAHAYGVDRIWARGDMGQGQTIVLVDSYGSPTAANDLNFFYQTFFKSKGLPAPNFTVMAPFGGTNFTTCTSSRGLSGPCAAAGWSGEATLDVEWSYAMAPLAHIVLLETPPAEVLGVTGLPNMFKAMRIAIDTLPAGTIFSQSFGLAEQTFDGAALTQMQAFDQTYQYGESTKGDTFLASSGDEGNGGADKNHKLTSVLTTTAVGFPAVSPYVTAVGGTQLMDGWTLAPSTTDPLNYVDGGQTEALWNECGIFGGGNCVTGGGTSSYFASPSWQAGQTGVTGGMRGIPDLSWNAAVNGGVLVYQTSFAAYFGGVGWFPAGGTSAASPQMAGVVALAEQMRGKPFGNFAPFAYALGNRDAAHPDASFSGTGKSYYRDIVPQTFAAGGAPFTLDNNSWPPVAGLTPYYALPGYDLTTGFGSPRADLFVQALAQMK